MTMATRVGVLIAALLLTICGRAHDFSGAHGTIVIDWSAPNVSRVLASGYGDSFGTEAWARKGLPELVDVDGRRCVDATYLVFDVDDRFAFDIDETVTIEFLFDRRRSAGFLFSYDQNVEAENLQEVAFAESDQDWHRHTLTLERARFANRGESGADFTIAALDGAWFGDAEADHRIVLCDLRISRSHDTAAPNAYGEFGLEVSDNGDLTQARVGLYDATGRMPLPADDALEIRNYEDRTRQVFLRDTHGTVPPWPHENRFFFYVDGSYRTTLPEGRYSLVVTKGPEFRREVRDFEVRAGSTTAMAVELARWTDMPALGWYSGDDHVHMTRLPQDNASISALMRAEDVHVTNLLQMGNPYDTHVLQYAFGPAGRYQSGQHALVPGVEDPRTAVRGHTISLNIREVFRPDDRYLRYERIFGEYRGQGGLSGYAHVAGRLFNVERGLAIDVPLGAVDFVELLQDGALETELWYDFLNMGFKLIPMAGSDFPYLGAPGSERNYVHVGTTFSVDGYYRALGDAKTFVSNGPMLELSVNGLGMGAELTLESGAELTVVAGASLNPDIENLDRLELVVHGEVVAATANVGADNSLSLDHTIAVDRGLWLAVRTYGTDQAVAHSAPVYVSVGDGFIEPDKAAVVARRMIRRLEEFETVEADVTQELEAWSIGPNLRQMLDTQRAAILERADEARAIYARMIDRP